MTLLNQELYDALINAGCQDDKARAAAHTHIDPRMLATKLDISELKRELSAEMVALRMEMGALRADTQTEFGKARAEMQTEFGKARNEMQTEFGEIRAETQTEFGKARNEMHSIRTDLMRFTVWLFLAQATIFTAIVSAVVKWQVTP